MHKKTLFKPYSQLLDSLNEELYEMSERIVGMLDLSHKALFNYSEDFVTKAKNKDKIINKLEENIEKKVTDILRSHNPMAHDLRFVLSSIKISGLLERIADRAKKSIKYASKIEDKLPPEISEELKEMNEVVINMVSKITKALKNYDYQSLKEVYEGEQDVNFIYENLIISLQNNFKEDSDLNITRYTNAINIIKSFERIGDYVLKLAHIVYYIESGDNKDFEDSKTMKYSN